MGIANRQGVRENETERVIPTTCYMCFNACNVLVHVRDGVVVALEGNPKSPHNSNKLCAKGHASIMHLYNPQRVKRPMKRTNPEKGPGVDPGWQEIGWDEAMGILTTKLSEILEEDPRQLLIASFDVQSIDYGGMAFGLAFGTPNVTTIGAGYFCGSGMHPVAWLHHGTFYMEPDFDRCNYLIEFGSQTGIAAHVNLVGLASKLADARARGMKLVVVDPVCSPAAVKADEWIPIRPGTDAAFALGLANVLVNELGVYDRNFVKSQTNGPYLVNSSNGRYCRDPASGKPLVFDVAEGRAKPFDATDIGDYALSGEFVANGVICHPAFELLSEHLRQYDLERVSSITGIPVKTIRRIAGEYGSAAMIGATITVDGVELPYRPACVDWSRGPIAHKHALMTGLSIQLLNTLIGAVDVPGGHLGVNAKGPFWSPGQSQDGLLTPAPEIVIPNIPYPPAEVKLPETVELKELFPLAYTSRPVLPMVLMEPEKFGLPYKIKLMIQCRNNWMMSTVDVRAVAEAFKRIPFIVSFAHTLDASAEMADLVLPDAHYLERLDPFPNLIQAFIMAGEGEWYWTIRQPVVEPPPGVRPWTEVLVDVAKRLGIQSRLYQVFNDFLGLDPKSRLDPEGDYTYADIVNRFMEDRMLKLGGSVDEIKEEGVWTSPKRVEEAYPRPFLGSRIPLYYEYLLDLGEKVKSVVNELGLDWWDTSDYQALPEWKPCLAHTEEKIANEYDLWVSNYKTSYHAHTYTYEVAWLSELSDCYPESRAILINRKTAEKKGLKDGDSVILENILGREVVGTIRVTEGVHPEVLGVMGTQGHWTKGQQKAYKKGVHFNALIPTGFEYVDFLSAGHDACARVRVRKRSRT